MTEGGIVELGELTDAVVAVSDRYARVHGIERDEAWYLLKLHEEVGELTQAFLMNTGRSRDKGLSADELRAALTAEVADVFCQVLLLARNQGIDLPAAVADKWLVWADAEG
jgi:NTP pyrophosphatase (non-canonical NTP hydrolase)